MIQQCDVEYIKMLYICWKEKEKIVVVIGMDWDSQRKQILYGV